MLGRARSWIGLGVVASLCLVAVAAKDAPTTTIGEVVGIDHYPAQTAVRACARPMVGRPGVVDFRGMILSQAGGRDDGLAVCKRIANTSGAYSDHADGRAWDWHARASNPADRAMVDRVLNWLLRADEQGHRNAMARRLGITYIIWNHQYYRVGSDAARWVPYTSTDDPHDTHVHFSFSVAGADRRTSWWSARGPWVWSLRDGPDPALVYGEGALDPLAGDWDGDGRDTVGYYDPATRRFSIRGDTPTTPPLGPFGAIPFAGDWDGRGRDGLGLYDPMERSFAFYAIDGTPARLPQVFGAAGDLPVIGDWNGDGIDDIGTYTPGRGTFSRLYPDGSVRTDTFGRGTDTPIAGDWNGDGRDEIGAFRSSTRTFLLAQGSTSDGQQVIRSFRYGSARHRPIIGDWDGDGTDDEGVVAPGAAR